MAWSISCTIASHLKEGCGIRKTGRLVGASKDGVTSVALRLGLHARALHDERAVDLTRNDKQITFQLAKSLKTVTLGISQIRRLTRDPGNQSVFDLVYTDVDNRLSLQSVRAPGTEWPFCYQPLDQHDQPIGADRK